MNSGLAYEGLRRMELQFIQIEGISLAKAVSKYKVALPFTIPEESPQSDYLKRLITDNLRLFSDRQNSNLFAFAYMLLVSVYDDIINENLLNIIKSLLYEPSLNLTDITNHPFQGLTSSEMKKLVVEFAFQLQFTDHVKTLLRILQKYPVILHILVVFLRCLLVKYGIEQAKDYNNQIPSQTAYEMLSELLDLNFRSVDHSYMFLESHYVIYEESPMAVLVGRYYESQPSSISTEQNIKDSQQSEPEYLKLPSFDRKQQNFNFDSTIRESQYHDYDAPTPFFNLGIEVRQTSQEFKIERKDNYLQLNPYSSVPELKGNAVVPEDDQVSVLSQDNKSFEQKLIQLRNQENGWKSPIYNNGVILDDADNAFNVFQTVNRSSFLLKKSIDFITKEDEPPFQIKCSCAVDTRKKNRLCSRLYEINVLSMSRYGERSQVGVFDCMIISIKNVLSIQEGIEAIEQKINKGKRAKTFHDVHAITCLDFDRSFQSIAPPSPKLNLTKTLINLNSSFYSTKFDSRIKIIDKPSTPKQPLPISLAPRVKFTYTSTKKP